MKSSRIIIAVLVVLLIALGLYTFTLQKSIGEGDGVYDLEGPPEIPDFESPESNISLENYSFGEFEEWANESSSLDLDAENFLIRHATESTEEALTLTEMKSALSDIPEFSELSFHNQCRIIKRWLRRLTCKPKKEYYIQVVSRTKIGSVGYNDSGLVINAPQISRFRNTVNRLNAMIELLYNLRASHCEDSGFCYTNALLMACLANPSDVVEKAHLQCAKIYSGEIQGRFVEVLTLFLDSLDKFQDGSMTEEQVKQVVNADLDKVNQELNKAEEEQEEADRSGEDTEGEGDEDSSAE